MQLKDEQENGSMKLKQILIFTICLFMKIGISRAKECAKKPTEELNIQVEETVVPKNA